MPAYRFEALTAAGKSTAAEMKVMFALRKYPDWSAGFSTGKF